jgi:hypothetical protein
VSKGRRLGQRRFDYSFSPLADVGNGLASFAQLAKFKQVRSLC